jgi:putative endonuclease
MKPGWVYIMTNKPFGTLYIGVTSNLAQRISQHREGTGAQFCRQHGLQRLVYIEQHAQIYDAIVREKAMKAWKRVWKTDLIESVNPEWNGLFERINW